MFLFKIFALFNYMNLRRYEDYIAEYDSYLKFLKIYQKTKRPYEDHSFHPFNKIEEKKGYFTSNKIEWKRIDEVYKTPLFDESRIGIGYMMQGGIGDCYFIAALIRIAKEPQLVRKLFDTECNDILGLEEDSIDLKCGAAVVLFHAFGQTTPVVIDTLIPFYTKTNTPIFSRPKTPDASPWFCLVEKAYAKLNGSYSQISGGLFHYTFYTLFNYWPDQIKIDKTSEKSPYKQFLYFLKKGSIISAAIHISIDSKISKEDVQKVGLFDQHAYLIEEVFYYKSKKFYRLRNPWGHSEWNGDWSTLSPLWTSKMMKDFNFDKLEEGSFWMIESDFLKYFNRFHVSSPIHSFFHSKSISITMDPGESDGVPLKSKKAKLDETPNYVIKIKEEVPPDEKIELTFFLEKRSYLIEKKTEEEEENNYNDDNDNDDNDSNDNDNDGDLRKMFDNFFGCPMSLYDVVFVNSKSKRLTYDVLKNCKSLIKPVRRDLFSFHFHIKNAKSPVTFALKRHKKSDYQDECFIKILCKYEFDLFEVDEPDELIEDDEEGENVFHNQKLVHLILSKGKKYFVPKLTPIYSSGGEQPIMNDKKSDTDNHTIEKVDQKEIENEDSVKEDSFVNAQNVNFFVLELKIMKDKIDTLKEVKKCYDRKIEACQNEIKEMKKSIKEDVEKTQTTDDESEIPKLVELIETKRNQLDQHENCLLWYLFKFDAVQKEINEIKQTYKTLRKKINDVEKSTENQDDE